MSKKEKRFEVTYSQGVSDVFRILVDKETGVNYLQTQYGYGGGVTPLLDANGNIVVTPVSKLN